MKKKLCSMLVVLASLTMASATAQAYTNPPVPNSSGVTTETCDVRSASDYGAGDAAIDKTLRHRIDLFNAELDGGPQKCIFGIYFLDPYSIKLKQPLKIRALKHTLNNGLQAGTYISGAKSDGDPLPVTINGYDVTNNNGTDCAIMIESALASIQQIHDVTIIATSKDRAICDFNGVDLMEQVIPETTVRKNCTEGQKAKDCDFKDVEVFVVPGTNTGGDDDNDGVDNGDDECPNTPPDTPVNDVGCPDTDGDGIFDNEDDCDTIPGPTKPHPLNGCPDGGGGPDQDGDGITDPEDYCDHDSTGNVCDSTNLGACFSDADDNVCDGVPVGASVACSEEEDMDNDGRGNRCDVDIDGDTLPNGADPDPFDKDADNDGDPDNTDPCPLLNDVVKNSLGQCAPEPINPSESDPDGDGCTTTIETEIGTNPNAADTDGDGFTDCVADCFPLDNTKHLCGGATTVVDPDFDNDGICNGAESGTDPVTSNPCTPNALGLGDNCPATPNADQKDDNEDGVGDACAISSSLDGDGDSLPDDIEEGTFHTDPTKPDTDGDGLDDGEEVNGPTYQNGAGPLNPDVDEDGICDGPATVSDDSGEICNAGPSGTGDNCPIVKNVDQADADSNGRGDACDGDMDSDGVADEEDNCPFIDNPLQPDSNEDGVGDDCDPNLAVSGIDGGCGCRMDGKSAGGAQGMIPFAALLLPLALLRLARRKASEE